MNMDQHGAFTGEVSGGMLKDIGGTYVIIGFSCVAEIISDL
jgi:triosephosphate isomerase